MTDATETPDIDPTAHAVAEVIQRFGGIRPAAKALRSPVTTVQGWKRRGHIPEHRIPDLEAAAARKGITLERDLLVAATGGTAPEPPQEAAAPTGETEAAAAQAPASPAPAAPADRRAAADDIAPADTPADADAAADPPAERAPATPAPADGAADPSRPATEAAEAPSPEPAPAEPELSPSAATAGAEPISAATEAPVPPPAAAASPVVPQRRSASGVAWFAILLGLVSASAAATSPLWAPDLLGMPTADRLQRQIDTLEAQLADAGTGVAERAALAERITALENIPAPSFDVTAIEARLATLDARPTAEPVDLAPLEDRLTALEVRVDGLGTVPQAVADAGATVDLSPLQDRLAALEVRVDGLGTVPQAAADGGATVDLSPLQDRLAALESRIDGLGMVPQTAADGGEATVDLAPLEDRLTALEATVAGVPDPTPAIASLREEIAALRIPPGIDRATAEAIVAERLAAFSPADIEAAVASLGAEAANRESRLAGLETRLETVRADLTAAAEQVTTADATLASLQHAVSAARAEIGATAETLRAEIDQVTLSTGPTQAFALAVSQLQEASRTGAPFPAAQATVQALAATDPALMTLVTPLAGPAAEGVPTAARLSSRFDATAETIRRAVAENRDGSWIDRSLSTVTSVVTIRRTSGEASGDSLDAVLDRTADRLEAGNVAGAIEALDALDGPAADAAAGWLADARDRIALDTAVAALTQEAITRLASRDG